MMNTNTPSLNTEHQKYFNLDMRFNKSTNAVHRGREKIFSVTARR